MDVGALLGDKHGIFAMAEIVLLHKDAAGSSGTYTLFRVAVVVVVEDVQML